MIYLLKHLYLGGEEPVEVSCPGCDTCCPDFPARPVATGAHRCFVDVFTTRPCGDPTARNFGQDGDYQLGIPRQFWVGTMGSDDLGDWVTADPVLGLMWQFTVAPEQMTWDKGLSYCEELTLAGFDDWRMPNLFEFISLFNCGKAPPVYDAYFFWPEPEEGWRWVNYWTSTIINNRETSRSQQVAFVTMYPGAYVPRVMGADFGDSTPLVSKSQVRAVRTLKPGDLDAIGDW